MKSLMVRIFAKLPGILIAFGLTSASFAQDYDALVQLSSDRWQYPFNFTPGSRQNGPLFVIGATDALDFNARDGLVIIKWNVTLPPEINGAFEVVQATIRFWDRKQAGYVMGNLNPSGHEQRIELYAARFDTPYSEPTWLGTEPYIGAGVGSATGSAFRNPYPIDLLTSNHVENDLLTATPWALGQPIGYTPGAMTDSFPIDFKLDVSDPRIQAELQQDLSGGSSSWFISATFELDIQDASAAPQVLMSEAVGNAGFGVSHQPPSLSIKVRQAPSTVEEWNLYE